MRGMGAEKEIRGELDEDEGEEVEEEVEEDLMNGHDDYQAPGKDEKRREGLESTENEGGFWRQICTVMVDSNIS